MSDGIEDGKLVVGVRVGILLGTLVGEYVLRAQGRDIVVVDNAVVVENPPIKTSPTNLTESEHGLDDEPQPLYTQTEVNPEVIEIDPESCVIQLLP